MKEMIYTPDSQRKIKWFIWIHFAKDIWKSRELIWRLFLRDFTVRYRQSIFGYLWALIPPIITVALFVFLSHSRVLSIGETNLPYVLYALWGISLWQLFAGCLIACTNSLTIAGTLVTKVNFPKESLVIAAIGQPLIDFLIRLMPIIVVFFWYGIVPAWTAMFIPIILLFIIMLSLGIGFFLSAANLVFRDIGNLLSVLMIFGMFLAPVLYPPPTEWPFLLINLINPFSPLLIATHDLIAYGYLSNLFSLICTSIFSISLFIIGWQIFHITMPRIAERA
jgi:lipopolysaccharide transport system permease protein